MAQTQRTKSKPRAKRGRRPTEEITTPQRRTFNAIRSFITKRGFPPTMQELGEILGISAASAHEQVKQLVQKGYIRREPRKARSLEVLKEPDTPARRSR